MKSVKLLKREIKLFFRFLKDIFTLQYFYFVGLQKDDIAFPHYIELKQDIKKTDKWENKIYNLTVASTTINAYVLMPGEIFSFWEIIGRPSVKYRKGRSIVGGEVKEEIGGGLCQVSGIIYHVALLSGLLILERHNHSVDIYTEGSRFTPLGTDATVVYGYKDLRMKNNLSFPIKLNLKIEEGQLCIQLLSAREIIPESLVFEPKEDVGIKIITVRNQKGEQLNQSRYKNLMEA